MLNNITTDITPDFTALEKRARELRRQELARLGNQFSNFVANFLRNRHESVLRRPAQCRGMRSVNATPA